MSDELLFPPPPKDEGEASSGGPDPAIAGPGAPSSPSDLSPQQPAEPTVPEPQAVERASSDAAVWTPPPSASIFAPVPGADADVEIAPSPLPPLGRSSVPLQDASIFAPVRQEASAADARATLSVSGLRKVFGRKVAVSQVSFGMKNGEVVGLLGPNGAGKTTIFYMIVGFIHPTEGRITLDGKDISRQPMYKRAREGISYLPQEASIFKKMTVEQNIMSILETRADLKRSQRQDRLEFLLEEFRITGIRKQFAYTLSGGERRRTEIARALAIEPKFLLLDEPFAGIDPIAVHEIKSIVRRLSESGIGVLITDHNVRETMDITHTVLIINQGEILISGSRETILESEAARSFYLGAEFRM